MKKTKTLNTIIYVLISLFLIQTALSENETAPAGIDNIEAQAYQDYAIISWTTDESTNSIVEYGPSSTGYIKEEDIEGTDHNLRIESLSPGVTYYYIVGYRDADDVIHTSPSQPLTFKTLSGNETGNNTNNETVEPLTLTVDSPTTPTGSKSVKLTGTASKGATIRVYLNPTTGNWFMETITTSSGAKKSFMEPTSTGNFTGTVRLKEGTNQIVLVANDEYYNKIQQEVTVEVDSIPPTLKWVETKTVEGQLYISGFVSVNSTARISGNGTDQGISLVEFTSNNDSMLNSLGVESHLWDQFLYFNQSLNLPEGRYEITMTATDSVGNNESISREVVFDRTPPRIAVETRDLFGENKVSGTVHTSVVTLKGNVSESCRVIVRNYKGNACWSDEEDKTCTTNNDCDSKLCGSAGKCVKSSLSGQASLLGSMIGYEKEGTYESSFDFKLALYANRDNSSQTAQGNNICIRAIDASGNIAQTQITLNYEPGSRYWEIRNVQSLPNEVYTTFLKRDDIQGSLTFNLHYFGPTSASNVEGLVVDLVAEDTYDTTEKVMYGASGVGAQAFFDEAQNIVIVYAPYVLSQWEGDPEQLPDELTFRWYAQINYKVSGVSQNEKVFFQSTVKVERPLDHTKWLTPETIDDLLEMINDTLNITIQLKELTADALEYDMYACAAVSLLNFVYQSESLTEWKYRVCDRILCPKTPISAKSLAKNEQFTVSPDGRDYSIKLSNQDGNEVIYQNHLINTCTSQGDSGTTGDTGTCERNGGTCVNGPCANNVLSGYSCNNGYVCCKRGTTNTQDATLLAELREAYGVEGDSNSNALVRDARSQVATAGGCSKCPTLTVPTLTTIEPQQLNLGDETHTGNTNQLNSLTVTKSRADCTNLNMEDYSQYANSYNQLGCAQNMNNAGCDAAFGNLTQSLQNTGLVYNPQKPYYHDASCAVNLLTSKGDPIMDNVNPYESLAESAPCLCFSGMYNHLGQIERVLKGAQRCLMQARIGEVEGGYCERLLSQYVCDFIFWFIEKLWNFAEDTADTSQSARTGNENSAVDASGLIGHIGRVNDAMGDRYGDVLTSAYGLTGQQLMHKTCMAAIGGDWDDIEGAFTELLTAIPVEPIIGPTLPESRVTGFNPLNGQLSINYMYNLGILSGGQPVEYTVTMICDRSYEREPGTYCPSTVTPKQIDSGVVAIDGSVETIKSQTFTDNMWYNKMVLTVKYQMSGDYTTKQITEGIVKKGNMVAQCHASVGLVNGFDCNMLTANGAGTVTLKDAKITPSAEGAGTQYYPGMPIRVKLLISNANREAGDTFYANWKITDNTGKQIKSGSEAINPEIFAGRTDTASYVIAIPTNEGEGQTTEIYEGTIKSSDTNMELTDRSLVSGYMLVSTDNIAALSINGKALSSVATNGYFQIATSNYFKMCNDNKICLINDMKLEATKGSADEQVKINFIQLCPESDDDKDSAECPYARNQYFTDFRIKSQKNAIWKSGAYTFSVYLANDNTNSSMIPSTTQSGTITSEDLTLTTSFQMRDAKPESCNNRPTFEIVYPYSDQQLCPDKTYPVAITVYDDCGFQDADRTSSSATITYKAGTTSKSTTADLKAYALSASNNPGKVISLGEISMSDVNAASTTIEVSIPTTGVEEGRVSGSSGSVVTKKITIYKATESGVCTTAGSGQFTTETTTTNSNSACTDQCLTTPCADNNKEISTTGICLDTKQYCCKDKTTYTCTGTGYSCLESTDTCNGDWDDTLTCAVNKKCCKLS